MSEANLTPKKSAHRRRSSSSKVLDELLQQKICAVLTVGCSLKTAADYLGSRPEVIRRTARRDPQFAEQLAKSEAVCEVSALTQLGKALKDERNWRAVTWLLERRFPERYGRRKPRSASSRQLAQLMLQLVDVVAQEIGDEQDRRRVVERMRSVVQGLRDYDEAPEAS